MASLYPKRKSPYWWLCYLDPFTGKRRDESTKLRRDVREDTRKARQRCAQLTADELARPGSNRRGDWAWVDDFFVSHYPNAKSLLRARGAWLALRAYFKFKGVTSPGLLRRDHCLDYVEWRIANLPGFGLRKARHNTARLELQILSAIMREAVYRGKAVANPCLQLGIKLAPQKSKPEITEDQIVIIERRLKEEEGLFDYNEAMRIAWDIAIRHGCRISETCVEMSSVDLGAGTIVFKTKGNREQIKLLHPQLVPLFQELKSAGRTFAYDMPKNWAKKWKYFFIRCGLPLVSFHSTRVTAVNQLRRRGVDPSIRMDYIGHKSARVHQCYERFRPDDHAIAATALSRPGLVWSAPGRKK